MLDQVDISKAPVPEANESLERYTIRAHRQLLTSIADPEERNATVWAAWEHFRGPSAEREIAAKTFDSSKYSVSHAHCHFAEHETVGRDGKPRKYDLKTLAKIARQHNSEIRDASAFPAISDGHTPDPDASNPREPDVLGHAGPYRLGMIGRENPRFALFADEYHRRDSAEVLNRKPFRSVELWTFKDGRQRFHPIAAVGAEAPRLLMPARYTQNTGKYDQYQHEGASVERYTVAAIGPVEKYDAAGGAMPGGGSTFTKAFGDDGDAGQKTDYAAQAPVAPTSNPDIVRDVLTALSATPEFTYLRKCMAEEEAMAGDSLAAANDLGSGDLDAAGSGGDLPGGMGANAPGDDLDDLDDDGQPPDGGAPIDTDDLDDLDETGGPSDSDSDKDKGKPPFGHHSEGKEKKDKHSMANNPNVVSVEKFTEVVNENKELREKYTALHSSHESLMGDHKKLHDRVQTVERRATDEVRAAKIAGWAEKYSLAINPEEARKECLYSEGSNMTDAEFERYGQLIDKIGSQFSNSPMIPRGAMPERYTNRQQGDVEKYEERLSQLAVEYHSEQMKIGKSPSYAECQAEAKKRIGQNGHAAAV